MLSDQGDMDVSAGTRRWTESHKLVLCVEEISSAPDRSMTILGSRQDGKGRKT
jgi:hypothetical protein